MYVFVILYQVYNASKTIEIIAILKKIISIPANKGGSNSVWLATSIVKLEVISINK